MYYHFNVSGIVAQAQVKDDLEKLAYQKRADHLTIADYAATNPGMARVRR